MSYVPDYKVNLIAPNHMSDNELEEFHSSLREVLSYIKYSKDDIRLNELTKFDKRFHALEREAADVLNIVTNSNLEYPTGKETINVCTAIQKMREDSKLEGKMEGEVEGEKKSDTLMSLLFDAGRIEDAKRASKDKEFKQQLYKEFNL